MRRTVEHELQREVLHKARKSLSQTKMCHPSTLFVSPTRGGILQSSGFLDFNSLMALNHTCKANTIDELSLILLIENEITRNHQVWTIEEGMEFWREVCRDSLLIQSWLGRTNAKPIQVTRYMLSDASRYEVMFAKMLRAIPTQLERLQLVSKKCARTGETVLHGVATSGNLESLKAILTVFPEQSERLRAVEITDMEARTVLHCAASSGNSESIQLILSLYSEAERLQVVRTQDKEARTVLHRVARSGNCESVKSVLALYPESDRLQAVCMQDQSGRTVLHDAAISNSIECLKFILSLYPESESLRAAVCVGDALKLTVLHYAAQSGNAESVRFILSHWPESERKRIVSMRGQIDNTALHCAAQSGNVECFEIILAQIPESERMQVLNATGIYGYTVLHWAAGSNKVECIKAVLSLYPESQRLQALTKQNMFTYWTALKRMTEETRNIITDWLSTSEGSYPLTGQK